ncbi:hypothetical protein PS406_08320, partial [Pediococcus acidilactici]
NIKPLLNEENFDKKHLETKFPTFNKLQKSFKLEFSSGNMNLIEEKTYQLLNDDELTRCQNAKTDSLKKHYNKCYVNQIMKRSQINTNIARPIFISFLHQ